MAVTFLTNEDKQVIDLEIKKLSDEIEKLKEIIYVPKDILYRLSEPKTFNGTSDYIDTCIKLCDEDKDFSIVMDVIDGSIPSDATSLFHCVEESGSYSGIALSAEADGTHRIYAYQYGKEIELPIVEGNNFKLVITHAVSSGLLNLKFVTDGNVISDTSQYNWKESVSKTLLLGAYHHTNGSVGRFWNGTINECRVYNRVLSDEETNAFLMGE